MFASFGRRAWTNCYVAMEGRSQDQFSSIKQTLTQTFRIVERGKTKTANDVFYHPPKIRHVLLQVLLLRIEEYIIYRNEFVKFNSVRTARDRS